MNTTHFKPFDWPWQIVGKVSMLGKRQVLMHCKRIEDTQAKVEAFRRQGYVHLSVRAA